MISVKNQVKYNVLNDLRGVVSDATGYDVYETVVDNVLNNINNQVSEFVWRQLHERR